MRFSVSSSLVTRCCESTPVASNTRQSKSMTMTARVVTAENRRRSPRTSNAKCSHTRVKKKRLLSVTQTLHHKGLGCCRQ